MLRYTPELKAAVAEDPVDLNVNVFASSGATFKPFLSRAFSSARYVRV